MNFLLENLIDLPNVRIRNAVKEATEIFVLLDCNDEAVACPHCEKKTDELNQTRQILVRDLPISGHHVYLKIPRRQFYCPNCQKYFTEDLEFFEPGRRFTDRYEKSIYKRVNSSSIEQVRREEDLSWEQVNGIHQNQYNLQKKKTGGK